MSSLGIEFLRKENPGLSDVEIAEKLARKYGYVAVVRYKSHGSSDFTNFGTCDIEDKIHGYLNSPHCDEVEILYDGRAQAIAMTEDLILLGSCAKCDRETTQESLTLMGGNDFYFCPKCGAMFCDGCYRTLPLRESPGYGMCPKDHVEVKRALPGMYGT